MQGELRCFPSTGHLGTHSLRCLVKRSRPMMGHLWHCRETVTCLLLAAEDSQTMGGRHQLSVVAGSLSGLELESMCY